MTHDVPGWDEVSDLDRPGAFRVNLAVGRSHVPEVTPDVDYTQEDVLLSTLSTQRRDGWRW